MAPEYTYSSDVFVLVRWQSRNMAIPLSQLTAIDLDESTDEAIRRLGSTSKISQQTYGQTSFEITTHMDRC